MPLYGYECTSCGFSKDVLQKMSDAPLTDCPNCQQATFKKQLSAPGFRLKGGGWYETDFKTGSKKNVVDSSTPTASDSGKATSNSGKADAPAAS